MPVLDRAEGPVEPKDQHGVECVLDGVIGQGLPRGAVAQVVGAGNVHILFGDTPVRVRLHEVSHAHELRLRILVFVPRADAGVERDARSPPLLRLPFVFGFVGVMGLLASFLHLPYHFEIAIGHAAHGLDGHHDKGLGVAVKRGSV